MVEGTVVRIDKDEMLVDIGAKSEGVVSNRELYGRNTGPAPAERGRHGPRVRAPARVQRGAAAVLSLRRAGLEGASGAPCRSNSMQAPSSRRRSSTTTRGSLIVDCGIRGFRAHQPDR
ncbi:MAG: S1 RNA-binding domain-containing protein [Chloroflexota bacterium]